MYHPSAPYVPSLPSQDIVAAPAEIAVHCPVATHCDAVRAGANVVKNVPETAIKMGFNDRIKALVVKDGHPITLGAAFSSPPPMPACLPACSTG